MPESPFTLKNLLLRGGFLLLALGGFWVLNRHLIFQFQHGNPVLGEASGFLEPLISQGKAVGKIFNIPPPFPLDWYFWAAGGSALGILLLSLFRGWRHIFFPPALFLWPIILAAYTSSNVTQARNLFFLFAGLIFLDAVFAPEEVPSEKGASGSPAFLPLLILSMITGVLFRLYHLCSTPVGFPTDITHTGLCALAFRDQGVLTLSPEGVKALFSVTLAGFFKLFGFGFLQQHLWAAWIGVAGVPVIGLLGRELFHWRVGAGAAFLFAICPWAVAMSRTGTFNAEGATYSSLVFLVLFRAIRRQSLIAFAFCGLLLGLTPIMYQANWLIVPVVFAFLGLTTLRHRFRKPWLKGSLTCLLATVLTAGLIGAATHPLYAQFFLITAQRSPLVIEGQSTLQRISAQVIHNAKDIVSQIYVSTEFSGWYKRRGGLLNGAVAVLATAGLLGALFRLMDRRYLFLLLWLVFAQVGVLFSTGEDQRMAIAAPLYCLAAAWSLEKVFRSLRTISWGIGRAASLLAILTFLVPLTAKEAHIVFRESEDRHPFKRQAWRIGEYYRWLDANAVLLAVNPAYLTHFRQERMESQGRAPQFIPLDDGRVGSTFLGFRTNAREVHLLLTPDSQPVYGPILKELFPGLRLANYPPVEEPPTLLSAKLSGQDFDHLHKPSFEARLPQGEWRPLDYEDACFSPAEGEWNSARGAGAFWAEESGKYRFLLEHSGPASLTVGTEGVSGTKADPLVLECFLNHGMHPLSLSSEFFGKRGYTHLCVQAADREWAPVDGGSLFSPDLLGSPHLMPRPIRLSPGARLEREWGHRGTGPGTFENPSALAVNSEGTLFVSDYALSRITLFDLNGTFQKAWGGGTSHPLPLNGPKDLQWKNGRLYVLAENGVAVLDSNGSLLFMTDVLCGKYKLLVDDSGKVYVFSYDNEVCVFFPGGKATSRQKIDPAGDLGLFPPFIPALGRSGELWIFPQREVAALFTRDFAFKAVFRINENIEVCGVAIDSKGNFLVVDEGKRHVSLYSRDFVLRLQQDGRPVIPTQLIWIQDVEVSGDSVFLATKAWFSRDTCLLKFRLP